LTGQVFAIASRSPELQADRHSCKAKLSCKHPKTYFEESNISKVKIFASFNTCFENFGLISDNKPRRLFYQTANVLSAMAIKCYFCSKVE